MGCGRPKGRLGRATLMGSPEMGSPEKPYLWDFQPRPLSVIYPAVKLDASLDLYLENRGGAARVMSVDNDVIQRALFGRPLELDRIDDRAR